MKKVGFFVFLMFSLVSYVFTQTPQLTVAVSPFQARSGHTVEEAEIVTEIFTSQLVSTGSARVVDRNNFDKIMTEMKFQASDWADNNKVARLGAALNADSIITGQIMKLGNITIITASLLDIKTAQIISSSRMQLNSIDQVFSQMHGFVNEMVQNFPKPNPIIGKWRGTFQDSKSWRGVDLKKLNAAPVQTCILEFRPDGTIKIEKFDTVIYMHNITSTITGKVEGTYAILTGSGTGSYSYSYDKNNPNKVNIKIALTLNGIYPKFITANSNISASFYIDSKSFETSLACFSIDIYIKGKFESDGYHDWGEYSNLVKMN